MGELPEKLFKLGGESKEYWYLNPEGEKEFVILGPEDRLSDERCPIDGAHLITYSGDPHNVTECPACHKLGFEMGVNTSEEVFNKVIPYLKNRTERLKEELNHLEAILKLAQNSENNIKQLNLENSVYNEVNLSAKIPEPVIVDKSKADEKYNTRESQFTKKSRLNH